MFGQRVRKKHSEECELVESGDAEVKSSTNMSRACATTMASDNAPMELNIGVDGSALKAPRTGVGNYIYPILEALINAHPNSMFFLYSNGPIDVNSRPNLAVRLSKTGFRGPLWQNVDLPMLLRRDGLDVFWGANGFLPLVSSGRIGTVVTIHDLAYRFASDTLPTLSRVSRHVFQPISARSADRVVAVSHATAKDVERFYGRKVDAVIHPTVSKSFVRVSDAERERVREKFGLHGPFLLGVGTLEPRKNLSALIGAYELCLEKGLRLPKLVLVGRRGWRDDKLTRDIRRAEECGIVRTLGYVDDEDLPGLYASSEAFIFPTRYEGFGMPLLEAQLCGVPVLYSSHPAVREAAGAVGVEFEPVKERIADVLRSFAHGTCRLACRLPALITNSAEAAAAGLWDQMLLAAAKRRTTRTRY